MSKLTAIKKGIKHAGKVMTPHRYPDGCYVATTSKFEVDQVRVNTGEELETLYLSGYGVRMSNLEADPRASYICHANLRYSGNIVGNLKLRISSHLARFAEDSNLDGVSVTAQRKEQAFLRLYLLDGKNEDNCIICGFSFPTDFLISAHIKRRANCSNSERLDFDNVAALMCKVGCDDLFEKGYIFVDDGLVVENKKRKSSIRLREVISALTGSRVLNWRDSQTYYDWHKKKYAK